MKLILCSLVMLCTLPVFADVNMCVHKTDITANSWKASGTADGNRGYWIKGDAGCSPDENNSTEFICKVASLYGEAHCSKVGIITSETTEEEFEKGGSNCWCRITRVMASNGYWARFPGQWMWINGYACGVNCAGFCAGDVGGLAYLNTAFTSPQQIK